MIGFDQRDSSSSRTATSPPRSRSSASSRPLHPKEGRHQVEIAKALLSPAAWATRRASRSERRSRSSRLRARASHARHHPAARPLRPPVPQRLRSAGRDRRLQQGEGARSEGRAHPRRAARSARVRRGGLLFGKVRTSTRRSRSSAPSSTTAREGYEPELYLALARAKRFDELSEAVEDGGDAADSAVWRVVAAAQPRDPRRDSRSRRRGSVAAQRDPAQRARACCCRCACTATAADLIEEATQGSPSSEARQQVENCARRRRYEGWRCRRTIRRVGRAAIRARRVDHRE